MRNAKERNSSSILTECMRFKTLRALRGNGRLNSNYVSLFQYFSDDRVLKVKGPFLVSLITCFVTPVDCGIFSLGIFILQPISPAIALRFAGYIPVGCILQKKDEQKFYISSLFNFRMFHLILLIVLFNLAGVWFHYSGYSFAILQSSSKLALLAAAVCLFGFEFFGLNYCNLLKENGKYGLASASIGFSAAAVHLILIVVLKLEFVGFCLVLLITSLLVLAVFFYAARRLYVVKVKQWAVTYSLMFAISILPHIYLGDITRMLDRFFLATFGTVDSHCSLSLAQTLSGALVLIGPAPVNQRVPKICEVVGTEAHELPLNRMTDFTKDASVLLFRLALSIYVFVDYVTYARSACYLPAVYCFALISAIMTKSESANSLTPILLIFLGFLTNSLSAEDLDSIDIFLAILLIFATQSVLFMIVLMQIRRMNHLH